MLGVDYFLRNWQWFIYQVSENNLLEANYFHWYWQWFVNQVSDNRVLEAITSI